MKTKPKILKAAALAIDVGVPLVATLLRFPIWVERNSTSTVSGLVVLFAILSFLPIVKWASKHIRTPSVWMMWVILFAILVAIHTIIDEMLIVVGWGAAGNILGAVLYKYGERMERSE